ncbi:hypothetical protein WJX81_008330 [Elliptochloris bilobata]|uniref:DNA replication complex GINS protein PSF3 n=1 Tax=Elliptochloris bilobata TaxID=381761 RepID=A0AAW1SDC7_9CHLO
MADAAENYYDVHAILAEETLLPCVVLSGATGIGRMLDPSCDSLDLPRRAVLEMPLWLAKPLAERRMLQLRLPRWYNERMQRKMQAGAHVEDLRTRCPYFYEVALRMDALGHFEGLGKFVHSSFQKRYKDLLTRAHAGEAGPDATRLLATMSVEEAALFEAGRASVSAFDRWRLNGHAAPRTRIKRRLDGAPARGV